MQSKKPNLQRLFNFLWLFFTTIFLVQCSDPMETIEAETFAGENVFPNEESIISQNTLGNGSLYDFTVPENWDGKNLVIFAHGWLSTLCEPFIPDYQVGNVPIQDLITNTTGAAVARIGFYKTGLPDAQKGMEDLVDLVDVFKTSEGKAPEKVILSGVSMGGLFTALALEQRPDVFDGGIAGCGPYGNFEKELNYLGDFFVLFNYYFKDVLNELNVNLGDPAGVPGAAQFGWEECIADEETGEVILEDKPGPVQLALLAKITQNPQYLARFTKVLQIANVPLPDNPTLNDLLEAAYGIFRLNILGTNDIINLVGGTPFDNTDRIYGLRALRKGIINFREFRKINHPKRGVERISATADVNAYATTGELENPVVSLHNKLDPTNPFWHTLIYRGKTLASGSGLKHAIVPADAFGHCEFTEEEVLKAFQKLQILMALDDYYL